MAVADHEAASARTIMDDVWRQHLDDDAQQAAELVIDFRAETMTCPACLTTFPTGPVECPDCGLHLG